MDANSSIFEFKSLEVALPDGSIVDIATKEGANAFLKGVSKFDYFSSKLKEIRKLRKKKKRLNAHDERTLFEHFLFITFIAENADEATFRERIPQSEIQDWLDYNIEEIESFTEKRNWISTGRLNYNDFKVLEICTHVLCRGPVVLVYLTFESKKFFPVLANFIKARKAHGGRALPHVTICDLIGRVLFSTFSKAMVHSDINWSKDKIFGKFEASGILEQFLRCSTVPQAVVVELGSEVEWDCQQTFIALFEKLESCPSILRRKFKKGEPCGDTLKAILDGRDGSRDIEHATLNRLTGIARLVETMNVSEFKANLEFGTCTYCFKNGDAETPLRYCSRCHLCYYCSKECQTADWQKHKLKCRKNTKPERDRVLSLSMVCRKFMDRNSETVFQAMDEKCVSDGVERSDLAVEVDFMPNENGVIPAFHDSLLFRIVLVRDYISGKDIPAWLHDKVADRRGRAAFFKDLVKKKMPTCKSASGALAVHHADGVQIIPDYFAGW